MPIRRMSSASPGKAVSTRRCARRSRRSTAPIQTVTLGRSSDEEGNKRGFASTAGLYVTIGIGHILPAGLDHILFVLALLLTSARLKPLVIQISTFTVAHTATLGLVAAGVFSPAFEHRRTAYRGHDRDCRRRESVRKENAALASAIGLHFRTCPRHGVRRIFRRTGPPARSVLECPDRFQRRCRDRSAIGSGRRFPAAPVHSPRPTGPAALCRIAVHWA